MSARSTTQRSAPTGGELTVDPTENVKALVVAEARRQDDLRIAEARRLDDAMQHLREMVELQARHITEIRILETNRLASIRQVDVEAIETASRRASDQALVLENKQVQAAEALRLLVASNGEAVNARLLAIERAQYTGAGKGEGATKLWGALAGLIGLAIAAAALLMR